MNRLLKISLGAALLAMTVFPTLALGQVQYYAANLTPLNNSGVFANVQITLDLTAQTIRVQYQATGFEALTLHPGHIHGLFDNSPVLTGDPGAPVNSVSPTIADDSDGDGFIEVAEGFPRYGNILMPLTNVADVANDGGTDFPISDAFGNINYDVTFSLNVQNNFEDPLHPMVTLDSGDIMPLDLREIVLHGMTVAPGPGAGTPGEVNGTNGYLSTLPVASGEIYLVPEPSSWVMLAGGIVVLGWTLTRRRAVRA